MSLISNCGIPARKPSTTLSGQGSLSSSILAWAVDSPIPKVCSLTRWLSPPPMAATIRSHTSGSMARNSPGTPGVVKMSVPPTSIAKPTALPRRLWIMAAPSGSQACFRLASLGSMLRAAHQSRTCLSASGWCTSSTPAAAATSSAVRSSWVGPSPPFMIRMRAVPAARCNAATSRARSSPRVTFSATPWPNAASDWAIIEELLSTVSPLISSSPVSSK